MQVFFFVQLRQSDMSSSLKVSNFAGNRVNRDNIKLLIFADISRAWLYGERTWHHKCERQGSNVNFLCDWLKDFTQFEIRQDCQPKKQKYFCPPKHKKFTSKVAHNWLGQQVFIPASLCTSECQQKIIKDLKQHKIFNLCRYQPSVVMW